MLARGGAGSAERRIRWTDAIFPRQIGMTLRSVITFCLLLISLPSWCNERSTTATARQREIIGLMAEIDRAHVNADAAAFNRIWTDDYVLTDYRGRVKGRLEALSEWKSGEHRYASYVSDDIKVRMYRDTAVVTARVTRTSVSDPQNVGQFRHTRIFVRQGGRWRLAATQVTPILQP